MMRSIGSPKRNDFRCFQVVYTKLHNTSRGMKSSSGYRRMSLTLHFITQSEFIFVCIAFQNCKLVDMTQETAKGYALCSNHTIAIEGMQAKNQFSSQSLILVCQRS